MAKVHKSCIVWNNNSDVTPTKAFIMVLKQVERRTAWLNAINYSKSVAVKTNLYICEDHFNVS